MSNELCPRPVCWRAALRMLAPLAVTVAALAAASCAPQGSQRGLTSARSLQQPLQSVLDEGRYRLTTGDKLKVQVFNEPELTGEYEVGAGGAIAMPLIGDVDARTSTVEEVRQRVTSRLASGFLKSPKVSVQVVSYRPVYVQGEVRQSGEFPYRSGLTVADAIALAGGYTYRAVTDSIYLRRVNDPVEHEVSLSGSVPVLPGDNIRVPERFF